MLRIAGIESESFVDGTGIRYAIFTQGCAHNCEGCHNPETHDFKAGNSIEIDNIIKDIKSNPLLDGVTLSGGDPLYQIDSAIKLCKKIKGLGLNIWCYTGYTFEEIKADEKLFPILEFIDILVDGQYIKNERNLTLKFRGSQNQRIIDVSASIKGNKAVIINIE